MSKVITRRVPVKLTREERELRAAQLAETISKHDLVDAERKLKAKSYAADIEALNNTIRTLSNAVKNSEEMREMDCYEEVDAVRRIVHIKRCDTHGVVDTREMTESERQAHLPFGVN